MVKNLPTDAGDVQDAGSISGSGRSLEEKMATHSSILDGLILWTDKPVHYCPRGCKELDMPEQPHMHAWVYLELYGYNIFTE